MHTCMQTCKHAYMHTLIPAYVHTRPHACVHICIHAYMHTCIHAHMSTCTQNTCTHAHMHTCIWVSTVNQKSIQNRSNKGSKRRCNFDCNLGGSWADQRWILAPKWRCLGGPGALKINKNLSWEGSWGVWGGSWVTRAKK